MRKASAFTVVSILTMIAISAAQDSRGAQSASGISMNIAPVKSTFKVGDKVLVKVVITNQSSKRLWLMFNPEISSFIIRIQDDKGKIPQETKHGCQMHMSSACNVGMKQQSVGEKLEVLPPGHAQTSMLQPSQKSDFLLDISDEYVLDQPGTYTVDVTESDFNLVDDSRGGPAGAPREIEKVGSIRSNSVTLQVVP